MKLKPLIRHIYSGPWYKRVIVWFCTIFLAIVLLLGAVDVNFLWLFGRSPGFKEIQHPVTQEASEIFTCDSVLMGLFYNENRTPVTYEELSPILIRTLIATEDERFYHHHGVDFPGLFAALNDMIHGAGWTSTLCLLVTFDTLTCIISGSEMQMLLHFSIIDAASTKSSV